MENKKYIYLYCLVNKDGKYSCEFDNETFTDDISKADFYFDDSLCGPTKRGQKIKQFKFICVEENKCSTKKKRK